MDASCRFTAGCRTGFRGSMFCFGSHGSFFKEQKPSVRNGIQLKKCGVGTFLPAGWQLGDKDFRLDILGGCGNILQSTEGTECYVYVSPWRRF